MEASAFELLAVKQDGRVLDAIKLKTFPLYCKATIHWLQKKATL